MALVLTLRADEDFCVGDRCFVLTNIEGPLSFRLQEVGTDRTFHVTDAMSHEIMPDVFVAAGENSYKSMVRVSVDAPRELKVLRGEHYRGDKDQRK